MALRWSSFVECMERVSRWSCTNSAYVCIALCVWSHLKVLLIGVWHSMRSSFYPHASFCCPNALQWRWWLCVDLRLFDVWNGYWVGPKPTARTFSLLRLSSNLPILLVFDTVWGHKLSSPSLCVAQIHCNGVGDSALIFVRQTRVVNWPWTNRPYVSIAVCERAWTWMRQ